MKITGDEVHCWCYHRDCPMHNIYMDADSSTRVDRSDRFEDFCARGELGLFCDKRMPNPPEGKL